MLNLLSLGDVVMRKNVKSLIIKAVVCSFALFALAGCGSKNNSEKGGAIELLPTQDQSDSTVDNKTDETTSEEASEATSEEAPEANTIEYLNSLTDGTAGWTEDNWIEFANDMYKNACEAELQYEMCMPFETDNTSTIQVNGIEYYQCVGYSSIKEATADYYSLFSSNGRENKFDGIMVEQDGKLYIVLGGRGTDICYKDSTVLDISEIGDGYITFNVESRYYDDQYFGTDDMENHINSVNDTFTLVFEDRIWKVGTFVLPY